MPLVRGAAACSRAAIGGGAGTLSSSCSGGAVADVIDIPFGVQPFGVDFFGIHELTFAVGTGLVKPAAFDQFLVAILRLGTLLVASLGNVLRDDLLVIGVFDRGNGGISRRRRGRRSSSATLTGDILSVLASDPR